MPGPTRFPLSGFHYPVSAIALCLVGHSEPRNRFCGKPGDAIVHLNPRRCRRPGPPSRLLLRRRETRR